MIEQFPKFSTLIAAHKQEIENVIARFEPYSDFNFTSLYCWNLDGSTKVALLNNNLVIQLKDYLSERSVYSMLGDSQIEESIRILLQRVESLNLVPHVVTQLIKSHDFVITEDKDNNDYIYRLDDLWDLNGAQYKSKRKHLRALFKTYGDRLRVIPVPIHAKKVQEDIINIHEEWIKTKNQKKHSSHEDRALSRLFEYPFHTNLLCHEIFLDDHAVGFSINEILNSGYAICHFQKVLFDIPNLDIFLTTEVAKDLTNYGCVYTNWEQDLGIPGLRTAKENYHPVKYLKKHGVTLAA